MLATAAMAIATLALRPASFGQASRKRRIVVTIDDGPATGANNNLETFVRITDALRDAFVAEKVPAIMFINERQLNVDGQRDARVDRVATWLDAGLDLGNHTYAHSNLGNVSVQQFLDDIVKGEVISRPLLQARGKKLVWFRYPFLATGAGETAATVETFLTQRGYRIAPVSVDYHDYSFAGLYVRHLREGNSDKATEHFGSVMAALDDAFTRAEKRSVEILGYELPQTLLIHCNEMNALTLRSTLRRIRERGYTFVSMDEAMSDPAYDGAGLRPGDMGGGGFFNRLAITKKEARKAE